MKKNFILLLITVLSISTSAQNLVVNPSFEQTASNCGNFGGEGFFTDLNGSWGNASSNAAGDSCSSPDLFSSCNTIFGSPSPTNMPNSTLGFQYSRTGTHHAGIITHEALDNYREYIQGHTSAPLQAGVSYCVSMYVSRANDVIYATDNMGVYFTNTPYLRDPCPGQTNSLINVTPQLNYDCAPITDTTANWFRLQWNYVAVGGERYFTIGNFFNNANTTIVNIGGSFTNPYAYYFIDDVSIVASSSCCYADLPEAQVKCVDDAPFNLSATGGVGSSCSNTVTGTWSGAGITNAITGTFNPSVAGVGTHTLTYTMSCGFTGTSTVIVSACAALSVCLESNGQLTVSGGTGPYTWNVQVVGQDCSGCLNQFPFPPCEFPDNCAVATLEWALYTTGSTVNAPSSWPIQVLDSDGGSIEIASSAGLPLCNANPCALGVNLISSQDACDGSNNGSITVSASGNIGNVTYSWNSNPSQSGATASNLAAGPYTVTATDLQGCSGTLNITLGTETTTAYAGEDQILCKGQTLQLSATGGVGYVWNNGAGAGQTVTVGPGATITYTVTVTGEGGCPDTDDVLVTVYEIPAVNVLTPDMTVCNNSGPVQLDGSPAGGTFTGPGVSGNLFDPSVVGAGQYSLVYEYYDQQECPGEDIVVLTVDICTSISEDLGLSGLVVHPNPSNGLFVLEYTGELVGLADVLVTDLSGRNVLKPRKVELNGLRLSLDMNGLATGQYLLQVSRNNDRISTTRLTKF